MRRPIIATILALIALLAGASAAVACETYTFSDDGFGLERGVQWAFVGTVVREEPNSELPDRPNAVILRVERTVVGRPAGRELRSHQDGGCDGFWYRPGDRVVVAVPFYAGLLEPSPRSRLRPPYRNITNYEVAVWVLDGERIDPGMGPHSHPAINGRSPRTVSALLAALMKLPNTATEGTPAAAPDRPDLTALLLAGVAGAALMIRRLDH